MDLARVLAALLAASVVGGCGISDELTAHVAQMQALNDARQHDITEANALMAEAQATADPLEAMAILDHADKVLHAHDALAPTPRNDLGVSIPYPMAPAIPDGVQVYSASQCIGAVVMGVCHGAIAPGASVQTCHGQMLNGQCTGPMF
jgi:hypothetical protein